MVCMTSPSVQENAEATGHLMRYPEKRSPNHQQVFPVKENTLGQVKNDSQTTDECEGPICNVEGTNTVGLRLFLNLAR